MATKRITARSSRIRPVDELERVLRMMYGPTAFAPLPKPPHGLGNGRLDIGKLEQVVEKEISSRGKRR